MCVCMCTSSHRQTTVSRVCVCAPCHASVYIVSRDVYVSRVCVYRVTCKRCHVIFVSVARRTSYPSMDLDSDPNRILRVISRTSNTNTEKKRLVIYFKKLVIYSKKLVIYSKKLVISRVSA